MLNFFNFLGKKKKGGTQPTGSIRRLVQEQDYTIKHHDHGFLTLYDKKDYGLLQSYFKKIRTFGLPTLYSTYKDKQYNLLDQYEVFLHREYNDQTTTSLQRDWKLTEPLEIAYKDDRVVLTGLSRFAELITKKSERSFTHYAVGLDDSIVLPSDTKLYNQIARVPLDESGFGEPKGGSIAYAAVFPTTVPTVTIKESGIFDRQSGGTMLLRTVYTGSNVVNQIFNQTFVVTSHFIYQISV